MISAEIAGLIGIIVLFILILLRVPVGLALLLVGLIGYNYVSHGEAAFAQLGRTTFNTATNYSLSVIPMFILMGMILSFSGLAKDLFQAVDQWSGRIKGGMGMATIGASAIFSAISGSTSATTATMAKVAIPEMKNYQYHSKLSTACVAAGGTLGILIPPSVVLILYGVLTGESIGPLLIAGLVPGIIMTVLFMLTTYILIKRNPDLAPAATIEAAQWDEKIRTIGNVWPFLLIFLISVGGIFFGVFTPTEAGGVGAVSSLVVAALTGRFSLKSLYTSLDETARLTCMIFIIIIGATLFAQFLAFSGIPSIVTEQVTGWDVNRYLILFGVLFFLFLLGLFIEGVAIFVITLPILYPMMTSLGFDGIWFGIIMVLVINMGLITPPLGLNIYIVSGAVKDMPIEQIFKGVVPMLFAIIFCIAVLIVFPSIITFLPEMMQ